MRYKVFQRGKHKSPAVVWTSDGVITYATKAYAWAIGKPLGPMLTWAERHNRYWKCVGAETRPLPGNKSDKHTPARYYDAHGCQLMPK